MATKRKLLSDNMRNSLRQEKADVERRFETADEVLAALSRQAEQSEAMIRDKVVKDTFSLPEAVHRIIRNSMLRAAKLDILVNKSEVVRLGLRLVDELSDQELSNYLKEMERLKRGAPAGKK